MQRDISRDGAGEALLDLRMAPNRSLSEPGFLILMAIISVVSFAVGLFFTLQGAWPVMGFFGLDVLVIYIAFRLNFRAGRLKERLRLTPASLLFERKRPNGAVMQQDFNPYWVRLRYDCARDPDASLELSSHGDHLRFGDFLIPAERAEVAKLLTSALHRCRTELN
jgi:uncharacterized membrane protein